MEVDLETLNNDGDNNSLATLISSPAAEMAALTQHLSPGRVAKVLYDRRWSVEEHVKRLLDIIEDALLDGNPRLELSAMKQLDSLIIRAAGDLAGKLPIDEGSMVKVSVNKLPPGTVKPDSTLKSYMKEHDDANPTAQSSKDREYDPDRDVGDDGDRTIDDGGLQPGVSGARNRRRSRGGSFHLPPQRESSDPPGTPQEESQEP